MTWSLQFEGDPSEVGQQFKEAGEQAKMNNLPALEITDIFDAYNLVATMVGKYGRVKGSASGHWSVYGKDDQRNKFGSVNLTISNASKETA